MIDRELKYRLDTLVRDVRIRQQRNRAFLAKMRAELEERKRADADENTQWITVNGTHIPISEAGKMKGPVGEKINAETRDKGKKSVYNVPQGNSSGTVRPNASIKDYIDEDGNVDVKRLSQDVMSLAANAPHEAADLLRDNFSDDDIVVDHSLPIFMQKHGDKIHVNPHDPYADEYDARYAVLHEVGHNADFSTISALSDANYRNSVSVAMETVGSKMAHYINEVDYNPVTKDVMLGDVLSALSKGKLVTSAGHEPAYWKRPGLIEREIFADVFAMQFYQQTDKGPWYYCKANFPDLCSATLKTMGVL